MPIVKRNDAHYDAASAVSLGVFGESGNRPHQSTGMGTRPAAATKEDSRVEIIRAANGDITKINVRCNCGEVASFYCDYKN